MPNWCMTAYTIEGNKRTLNRIKNAIERCLSGEFPKEENSAYNWEGNVLNALGIKFKKRNGEHKYCVRGFLYEKPILDDCVLKLNAEEAWSRTDFAELLKRKFPSITVYWVAEESGCDIFQTNDTEGKYYDEKYWVDACVNGNYMSEYFQTEESAYDWICRISGCKNESDVEAFNDRCAEEDSDDYIYVHEFEVV